MAFSAASCGRVRTPRCILSEQLFGVAVPEHTATSLRVLSRWLQVCGDGATVGDAVVPLQSAFLDGAECLELEGVFHSMSRLGTYSEASGVLFILLALRTLLYPNLYAGLLLQCTVVSWQFHCTQTIQLLSTASRPVFTSKLSSPGYSDTS